MIIFFKPSIHLKIRKLFSQTTKESQQVLFFLSSPCKWETSLFAFEVRFVKIPTISKLDVHGWFFLGTIDSLYSLTKNCHIYLGWLSLKNGPKELPFNITHNLSIFRIWKTILKFLKSVFFWKTGLYRIFKNEKVK